MSTPVYKGNFNVFLCKFIKGNFGWSEFSILGTRAFLYVKLYVKIKYNIIKHHNENVRVKRVHPRRGAKVFMCEDVYVFCETRHLGRKCRPQFTKEISMFSFVNL